MSQSKAKPRNPLLEGFLSLMSAGLKPWMTKGTGAGAAAWGRLSAGSKRPPRR
ncbi:MULTISPECIES: hypothetical protein [unclassified Streptomyces]|uniref:hypothetical protein n=1 Tax=unclassified Streptomyces TaxID=2593676 RepID=UPI0038099D5F